MTKKTQIAMDVQRIAELGGPAAVARKLGLTPAAAGTNRVCNWLVRGIPARIKLEHPRLFKHIKEK